MTDDAIGLVTHYYDKIGVAIVKLEKVVKVGDRLKFAKGDDTFEQIVASMQVDRSPIEEGKPGQEVGIKVDQKIKVGTRIVAA